MRNRPVLVFLLGLLTGGALLYAVLWNGGWLRGPMPAASIRTASNPPASVQQQQAQLAVQPVAQKIPAPPPDSAVLSKSGDRLPPILQAPAPQAELGAAHPPPFPSGAISEAGDYERLRQRLLPPIAGLDLAHLHDSFKEMRGVSRHEALDIPAPYGTLVVAVDDGPVKKLFLSQRGGLTVYQFDSAAEYCYYYAHLDRYAEGLKEGLLLKKGAILGYVGTSGNAPPDTPHLHFAIFKLGPEKLWWQGTPLNPFEVYGLARRQPRAPIQTLPK